MTREEAINECLKIQAFGISENQINAMELAISALSESSRFDGMTNGEVMKAMFPYIEVSTHGVVTSVKGLDCDKGALDPYRLFWADWWDAPYKAESEEV